MDYLLYTLIFQKKYFENYENIKYDDSFVRFQLINKEIYNIYKSLLHRDIAALKLLKYFNIIEFSNLTFLRQLLWDKTSYTYIIKSIGNLEFIPEFNYFNKKFNRENCYDICLRRKEIDSLDIFKPYRNDKKHYYQKKNLLNKLSKLGLHYPIRSKSMYYFTF